MLLHHRLRKELLIARRQSGELVTPILRALSTAFAASRVATLEEGLTSNRITRALWDLLPDESESYRQSTPEEVTALGSWCLNGLGDPSVVLHLGWGPLAFITSLHAAWTQWPAFASVSTDTFNSCIYPASLRWYLIRSGGHLYPVDCTSSDRPRLMPLPAGPAIGTQDV